MSNLVRINHNEPDFDLLTKSNSFLRETLFHTNELAPGDWECRVAEILAFQDADGSFKLLDSYEVVADARVEFCHFPTYLCTAILMKALCKDEEAFANKEEIMGKAMKACMARSLHGHGYEAFEGMMEAVEAFRIGHVHAFLKKFPGICPEFAEMFKKDEQEIHDYLANRNNKQGK